MFRKFDYFVIFAGMRTGSNFLERNLGQLRGVHMLGEAFNSNFIGRPKWSELYGITMAEREADPHRLLRSIAAETETLPGFRFFFDHDPRVLNDILNDPRCGKIVLTRNPVDSYISVKLAAKTGQWMLTDMTNAKKDTRVRFDPEEFQRHLDNLQGFQLCIQRALQVGGQTAFYIHYDDINDLDVLNGLAAYLGIEHHLERVNRELKPQNPKHTKDKVRNWDEMRAQLKDFDRYDLSRTPNFEPRRAPLVPTYYAAAHAPLLFLPIRGGPVDSILNWMADVDRVSRAELLRGFTQKTLKTWKRQHAPFRSFTVLRHPLSRAHDVFCRYILGTGESGYATIRDRLIQRYDLPIPRRTEDARAYGRLEHQKAFMAFLTFLKGNLSGQTGIRVDAAWASQAATLRGMAETSVPDYLLREEETAAGLEDIARALGMPCPTLPRETPVGPFSLKEIYSERMEAEARKAYQPDYVNFGFGDWC